ncbi:MAG: sigma 54-interacting transcriptional regulator [Planctomycetes bacterium]|nr:sigma 54-interacting transcriptional regulator [Planctomycetota bacterium]
MPKLLIIEGMGKGTTYEISGNTSLGRASSNLIQLFGKQISRNHSIIVKKGSNFIIRDLNSRNGIFVNSKKVEEQVLKEGDEIAIGTVKMIYEPSFDIKTAYGKEDSLIVLPDEESVATSMITTSIPEATIALDESRALTPIKKTGKTIDSEAMKRLEVVNQRLKALYEIASLSGAMMEEEELLKRACEIIFSVIKAERVAIMFSDEAGNEVHPAIIRSPEGPGGDITLSQTILKEVIKNKRAVFSPDIEVDKRFQLSQSIRLDQIKSILCTPLVTKNRLIGAIYLDTRDPQYTFIEDELHLLIAISQQVAIALENTRLYHQVNEEVKILRKKTQEEASLIGEDKSMQDVLDKINKIASSDVTVLLGGETGTGKELIAHAIHYAGNRRDKPFIAVDCSTIPVTLLESELFGHERGAFTGASRMKVGKFELAEGGTIFLDEISNMDMATQAKFLRVLEERKFTRVGGIKVMSINVRIIAATNEDLEMLIKEEKFREDLYYRLAVMPIILPPLRDRKNDIPLLAKHFLRKFAETSKKNITSITPEAMKYLVSYNWPGNVRELRNIIERAVVLGAKTIITPEELPMHITKKAPTHEMMIMENLNKMSLDNILKQVEKQCIIQALTEAKGRKTVAVKMLRISRPTLDKKIKEYDIPV